MTSPVVLQGVLAIVIVGLVASFAYAFGSDTTSSTALRRIRERRAQFRAGGFFVVAGIVMAAEADAILVLSGLSRDSPAYAMPTLAGYVLILVGVAVLDLVLWAPERAGRPDPSAAATPPPP